MSIETKTNEPMSFQMTVLQNDENSISIYACIDCTTWYSAKEEDFHGLLVLNSSGFDESVSNSGGIKLLRGF